MQLEILDRKTKEIDNTSDMFRGLVTELEKSLENYKYDEKNFINELSNEFNIPKEHLKELNDKIDNFLSGLYSKIGNVYYIGYDKDKNIFYEAICNPEGVEKNEMFDEYAKSHGIGTFHISFKDEFPKDGVWLRPAEFIKDDIKFKISEYLNEGYDIEDISFSDLTEKYSDPEYIEHLREKYYV